MPIAEGDLKWYGSAVMADDDTTTNIGGAIDTANKVEFTDITPPGLIEMVSSNAGDTTQTVTLYGRNASGVLINEAKALNGVTVVDFTLSWERILKVVMTATAVGTVTIRKDAAGGDLILMEPGVTQVRRLFYSALAEEVGGSARNYYEKIFVKNTHGSLTLTSSVITEFADPSTVCSFDCVTILDGNDDNGANNRQVAPGGYVFASTAHDVANSGNLTFGSAQGIWMELTLAAGLAPAKTSVTMKLTGNTT